MLCIRLWEPDCAACMGKKRQVPFKILTGLTVSCNFAFEPICQKKELVRSVKNLILKRKTASSPTTLNSIQCSTGKILAQVSQGGVVKGQLE